MKGRLIYLMGPSGSGKDSLIEAARTPLLALGCEVARRIITRSAQALGEDAIPVSREEFERRQRAGSLPCAGVPMAWITQSLRRLISGWRMAAMYWSMALAGIWLKHWSATRHCCRSC